MKNITCERCGAEYEVWPHETPTSEPTNGQCDCGHTLMGLQEALLYKFKLIKLGEEPDETKAAGE